MSNNPKEELSYKNLNELDNAPKKIIKRIFYKIFFFSFSIFIFQPKKVKTNWKLSQKNF